MSWFNTSLNSLKGQITNFAQEVLAEGADAVEDTEASLPELLQEGQRRNEELTSLCAAKDNEIASLRKQISDLLAKNSESGKVSKSAIEKNASLEDSWCWEPENAPSESSSKRSHERTSESSSGGGELIAIPLDSQPHSESEAIEKYQRFLDERDARLKNLTAENAALFEKINKLTDENVELQSNLEELDNQHNIAIKEVLGLKNEWQSKWNLLNSENQSLKQEHDLKIASIQKDYDELQSKFDKIQNAYALYIQENAVLKLELEQVKIELKIYEEQKQTAEQATKKLEQELQTLQTQLRDIEEKKSADAAKKYKDEDDFIVLQSEDVAQVSNHHEQKYKNLLAEKEKMQKAFDRLQEEFDRVKTDRDTIRADLEEKMRNLVKLNASQSENADQGEIGSYLQKIAELNEIITQQKARSSELKVKLKAENIDLQNKIIDLESSINKSNVKTSDQCDNVISFDDVNQLVCSYTKSDINVVDRSSLETMFKAIADKIWKVELLEKNLKEMADEILHLKTEKLTIEHVRSTLQADIEHYEVECGELMKNNEILLNELENYKRNKLETIPEHNEETIACLEKQLEESNGYLKTIEDQYNETVEKLILADEKRYELEDHIDSLQESNVSLSGEIKSLKDQIESLENDKSNLIFEINEMKTDDKKSAIEMEILEYRNENEHLKAKYEQLNKDHSELMARFNVDSGGDQKVSAQVERLQHSVEALTSDRAAIENENQVLKSQFEHYDLKCAHLKEDNEMLRKEIEELKSNKPRDDGNMEEVLRRQLEETRSGAMCIEDRFNEISQRMIEIDVQNSELRSELAAQHDNNTNLMAELATLKMQVERLEADKNKLIFEINELRTDDNKSEAVLKVKLDQYETNVTSLENQLDRLSKDHADLVAAMQSQKSSFNENRKKLEENISNLEKQLKEKDDLVKSSTEQIRSSQQTIEEQQHEIVELKEKLQQSVQDQQQQQTLNENNDHTITEISQLKQTVDTLTQEKANLIATLTTKHNENTQYYMEIQRLSQLLQVETEKLQNATTTPTTACERCQQLQMEIDQNSVKYRSEFEKFQDQVNFLKEKSDILTTNLVTEQTNQKLLQQEKAELVEQNNNLRRDLERLRAHLVELEEAHTQETLELQNSIEASKQQMQTLQEEVSNSSNAYTSASIRATQHAETLQAQYLLVCQQRDEFVAKVSAAEDRESKSQAALVNLQCALEQFQKEKEADIQSATLRIRKELQSEQDKQAQLQTEIKSLQNKLVEANHGLLAAARLSDQLEISQVTIAALKDEVAKQQSNVESLEKKLKATQEGQEDKVEKNLVKSLLIGYIVSSNPNDKNQILRLISTILDFNQIETDRIGLNKSQGSWLTELLQGGSSSQQGGNYSKDSLAQAFVNFLEKESQPRPSTSDMPNLLSMATEDNTSSASEERQRRLSQQSSSIGSAGIQPILLNENVLEQFAPNRNSSSILKDILNDS